MRLVIDLQGAQTNARLRGIGRMSLMLALQLARDRANDEVIIALNGAYPDSVDAIRIAFAGILPPENLRVWSPAPLTQDAQSVVAKPATPAEVLREAFIDALDPDVILITSLFEEFGGAAVTSIGRTQSQTPVATVLYDLIPLIFPTQYLAHPAARTWYYNKLHHLRRSSHLLAISESASKDAQRLLDYAPDQISVVYAGRDISFAPQDYPPPTRLAKLSDFGISGDFFMYVGGSDFRKNVEGLISAFSKFSLATADAPRLLLVGNELPAHAARYQAIMREVGASPDLLIFTGQISDDDLQFFYNTAIALVFPSLYEGFGLPILEAMACGTPVIAANTSSIPELVDEEALFSPNDETSLIEKLTAVLVDQDLRKRLIDSGLAASHKFSWCETSRMAWDALRSLNTEKAQIQHLPASRRPRLAYVSPIPPARTGIADYSSTLLPALSAFYDISIISESSEPVTDPWILANFPIREPHWFREHAGTFDRILYHFGNSPFHSYMLPLLLSHPGVVVLHDVFIPWLFWHIEKNANNSTAWLREIYNEAGWVGVREKSAAKDVDAERILASRYPCAAGVISAALGVIVHSLHSQSLAAQHYGADTVRNWSILPLARGFQKLAPKDEIKARLGFHAHDLIVCTFGFIGESKLTHRLVSAWLHSSLASSNHFHLILVGQNHGGAYGEHLTELLSEHPKGSTVRITGFAPTQEYFRWLNAADIAVQLRTDSRGETSAAVLDCLAAGVPTIVNRHGSLAELPTNSVLSLPDDFTDAELLHALTRLSESLELRLALSKAGRHYVTSRHAPRLVAEAYANSIESHYQRTPALRHAALRGLATSPDQLAPCDWPSFSLAWAQNFPPQPRRRRLFVDISALVKTELHSGIERVSRSLLTELLSFSINGWLIEAVYATTDHIGYRHARAYTNSLLGLENNPLEEDAILAVNGDIILILDFEPYILGKQFPEIQRLRRLGATCHTIIYDTLPLTLPWAFPTHSRQVYREWFDMVRNFDGLWGISQYVATQVNATLSSFSPSASHAPRVDWFHLGNNLPALTKKHVSPQGRKIGADRNAPIFLMVGTIEPRKAYRQAVYAFEKLWEEGSTAVLVVVGREGWLNVPSEERVEIAETVRLLETHPERERRLFWLADVSDAELSELYRCCTCLLAASYDEGFGLPLVEAAGHKLALLVRDIPVFREITNNSAHFFADSRDPEAISIAIRDWLELHRLGTHPRPTDVLSQDWRQSTQQLLQKLISVTLN